MYNERDEAADTSRHIWNRGKCNVVRPQNHLIWQNDAE